MTQASTAGWVSCGEQEEERNCTLTAAHSSHTHKYAGPRYVRIFDITSSAHNMASRTGEFLLTIAHTKFTSAYYSLKSAFYWTISSLLTIKTNIKANSQGLKNKVQSASVVAIRVLVANWIPRCDKYIWTCGSRRIFQEVFAFGGRRKLIIVIFLCGIVYAKTPFHEEVQYWHCEDHPHNIPPYYIACHAS